MEFTAAKGDHVTISPGGPALVALESLSNKGEIRNTRNKGETHGSRRTLVKTMT